MTIFKVLGVLGVATGLMLLTGCGGNGASVATDPPGLPIVHGKWTVLVYMNAANDLDAYSPLNIRQMQQAAGAGADVRFVVQWKQTTKTSLSASFNGTRRYLITPSNSLDVVSQLVQDMGTGVDMGIPSTVNDFVAWGKKQFPADHYCLVMWDHGNGWLPSHRKPSGIALPPAVSYDEDTGHSIQTWQLDQSLAAQHVDILAFDCSLMQMAEVAFQLRTSADFIVGSEESPPGAGYPYQRVFAPFVANPNGTPKALSKSFVDGMMSEPTYASSKVEQSVIDATQMAAVATATNGLAAALVKNAASINATIPAVRTSTQSYSQTSNRYYFDTVDLCNQLSSQTGNAEVTTAASQLKAAIASAVVWEGHNSHSAGSNGISIDFSPSSFFNVVSAKYSNLAWSAPSNWSSWLSIAP